ncbi:AraC family transcriptional regulator [Halalkalibacter sp. AB-rgal2]|uniref:AraC family transcriptional regulator n=1 Tax=Halalkalibacter sp. AB-rgal2 TaxID=3242695 RepID=UPI00359ECEE7
MDYICSIQKSIDYIEENLGEELSLSTLAEIAHFSPFHYHRIFQTMVGESVMDYVRKRRLTSAAERLYYTEEKVITIALEVGFHYQESFNRAFKKCYGISPKQYRNANYISGPLRGKVQLTPKITIGGKRMQPKLITKPKLNIIGYELKTKTVDGQNSRDIPQFWQQYMQNNLCSNIPNPLKPKEELGICTDFCPETNEFVYIIGKEVEQGTKAPSGLVYREFPEMEYAVFTTPTANEESFTSNIQSTWNYIFAEWFPQTDYEHNGTTEFELYDERCYGSEKEMDIYIPVKKRVV